MKTNYPIIDGHGHILPRKNQIPESIKKLGYFNIETISEKEFMTQKLFNWKRPVSHPTFFLEPRLEWMENHKITHTVMLTLSQLYCNGIKDRNVVSEIIKFQNDFQIDLQERFPKKFSCGFVVQPRFPEDALKEIEKRFKEGLKFLCLPTHYKNAKGEWTSCTDENCQEIFALADKLGLPVQVHPYDYEQIFNLPEIDQFWLGHIMGMASLTGCFYHMYINKYMHEKYPNVRLYLSHGNTLGMVTIGRAVQGFHGRPDYYTEGSKSPGYALQSKNIYCDSIVHDRDVIWLLKQKLGSTQIIHGIDSPYPLGDGVDYVKETMYPGFTLDDAEECGYINFKEKQQILCENAIDWLYGKNTQRAEKFIGFVFD